MYHSSIISQANRFQYEGSSSVLIEIRRVLLSKLAGYWVITSRLPRRRRRISPPQPKSPFSDGLAAISEVFVRAPNEAEKPFKGADLLDAVSKLVVENPAMYGFAHSSTQRPEAGHQRGFFFFLRCAEPRSRLVLVTKLSPATARRWEPI